MPLHHQPPHPVSSKSMYSKFIGKRVPTAAETVDTEHMPEAPQLGPHHHGSHSVLDVSNNSETAPHGVPMAVGSASNSAEASNHQNWGPRPMGISIGHLRSLTMYSELFDEIGGNNNFGRRSGTEKRVVGPRQAKNGSSTVSFDVDSGMEIYETKKFISHDKLTELALVDPKRAKRILDNRKSAARSKERQVRYNNELEKKVQALEIEATNLSNQLTILQIDTSRLTAQNEELKMIIEAMKQEAELRDTVRREGRYCTTVYDGCGFPFCLGT